MNFGRFSHKTNFNTQLRKNRARFLREGPEPRGAGTAAKLGAPNDAPPAHSSPFTGNL